MSREQELRAAIALALGAHELTLSAVVGALRDLETRLRNAANDKRIPSLGIDYATSNKAAQWITDAWLKHRTELLVVADALRGMADELEPKKGIN